MNAKEICDIFTDCGAEMIRDSGLFIVDRNEMEAIFRRILKECVESVADEIEEIGSNSAALSNQITLKQLSKEIRKFHLFDINKF